MKTEKEMDLGIITEMVSDAYQIRAGVINCGYCFIWAYLAYLTYPKARLHFNSGHAWISLGDKHYDAETPLGVRNPANLVMYNGRVDLAKYYGMRWNVKEEDFIDYWCEHGYQAYRFEMAVGRVSYPSETAESVAA